VVAERVAQTDVRAVLALDRLLRELHALGHQPIVGAAHVVGSEADGEARRAFADSSRICSAAAGSTDGGAASSSRISRPVSPGTPTVSQRMKPRPWSLRTSSPSLST